MPSFSHFSTRSFTRVEKADATFVTLRHLPMRAVVENYARRRARIGTITKSHDRLGRLLTAAPIAE